MRLLTEHIVNPVNDRIRIQVLDEPGSGGAYHCYLLSFDRPEGEQHYPIDFQNGPIAEVGVNGITQEALLAVIIDRLECFQRGPFASAANDRALDHCRFALNALHERTLERMARGVEGQTKA